MTTTKADIIHAEFADRAGVAEVVFTANTIPTGAAFGTQLIRCAIRAFFAALLADHLSALIASVAADTKIFHAIDTFAALGAKVAAGTVKAALALAAKLIVCTVLAFFAASLTDYSTVGASVAAVADKIHAVFAEPALGAVVSLTADAVKADIALGTKLSLRAVGAFFAAFLADIGTVGASVAVIADKIHAVFAYTAFFAVVALTADTIEAYTADSAHLVIGTVFAFFTAVRTNRRTV